MIVMIIECDSPKTAAGLGSYVHNNNERERGSHGGGIVVAAAYKIRVIIDGSIFIE